ncbi:MAG: hypothetical protein WKI04_04135 [Ferruginibacter sp.]
MDAVRDTPGGPAGPGSISTPEFESNSPSKKYRQIMQRQIPSEFLLLTIGKTWVPAMKNNTAWYSNFATLKKATIFISIVRHI